MTEPLGMRVVDAETGELVTLCNKTAFEEEDEDEIARATSGTAGGSMRRRQMAKSRAARGLPPIAYPPPPLVGLSADKAADLQVFRAKLDLTVTEAIEREEKREKTRQQLLRDEEAPWKRERMEKEFRRERKQARKELEQLRYDNELALAHRLAKLGLLK